MQKNPGAKTIEGDLEEALFQAGAVPEQDRGCPKRVDWSRSARTDKGVSAVGQVVSGKFYIDPPGLVERLNSILPSQFRIFGYNRVTASFSAKKFCDRRRYVYLVPVFALDKSCHRDRESVLASLGSGNVLVKCLECSERGRKVEGVMGNKRSSDSSSLCEVNAVNSGISSNLSDEQTQSLARSELSNSSQNVSLNNDKENVSNEAFDVSENVTTGVDKMDANKSEGDNVSQGAEAVSQRDFCFGDDEKERLNRILKHYEGTHNFHNFTTRTKAEDPSAIRYIISFQANTTLNIDGIDFVKCEVVGQSFMLHQIRKMIGLAVAIMRDCAPDALIETAFQKSVNINVPMAPEVGLYLDECFFTSYNQKWKDTHEELSMKRYVVEAEDFKMKHIYSHIAETEHKEGAMALWLHSLNYRNYPDLRYLDNCLNSD